MGKILRGKELGRCLYQRKDGRYLAKAEEREPEIVEKINAHMDRPLL